MDIENLLKSLNAHNVRYVVIGASALPVHGFVRATLDLDIFIEPSIENGDKTLNALREFGYDLSEVTLDDLLTKKVLLRQYLVETDIHPFVKGLDFETAWNTKVQSAYGETPAFFAGLDALITMKKAANRAKDIEDLKYLEEIKKRKSGG